MSEILKAKNRIMNRTRQPSSHTKQDVNQSPYTINISEQPEQTFDFEPVTSQVNNKKFNISSISVKFAKNQEEQIQNNQPQEIYRNIKLDLKQGHESRKQRVKEKSPQFSRTQRINPIRHFQPYHPSTLSESNSQSSLYKWSKNLSRKVSLQSRMHNDEQQEKRTQVRTTLEEPDEVLTESPIRKIRKTVHSSQATLLVARQQNRRAQSPFKPKQCIKEYTEAILKQSQQQKQPFTDQEFPPTPTIIFPKKSLYPTEPNLSFQRLPKIYQYRQQQISLLGKCEPTYIVPGKLTNPYLYSALRILAEYPEKVLSLFENQQVNEEGVYYVRICKDGTWRYVVVDDWVPVRVEDQKKRNVELLGIHSMTQRNEIAEIWPMLLEKALAKVYGTYYDLCLSRRDGICPLLRALTGFPVSKYDLIKDVRSYLVLIDSALKKDHIIVFEDILPQFEYLASLKGLSIEQSYQLLSIEKNCFLLRNLADIDLVTRVTFDEVMMFSSLLLFRKEDNYSYISQKLRHKKGYFSLLKATIPHNTACYWEVWQNNPAYYKHHLESKLPYEVSPYKIAIQPLSFSPETQFDSSPEPEMVVESGKHISLKKGEYLIKVHLCQEIKEMDFTLTYYGEKDISLERVKNYSEKWSQKCCSQQVR